MNTGSRDEAQFLADIHSIASNLDRIANFMGAAESRARLKEQEAEETTPEDIVRAGEAIAAVRRGFAAMEAATEERELFGDPPGEESRGEPPER